MPPPSRPSHFDRSIIEGSLGRAVWRIAWPTMLQNAIGGLQGIIDHAMVGHFVGYTANPFAIVARADLFVLASRWEGAPNALLEALVREHMGAAADLLVPLDVSVGTGLSWHAAAH